MAADPTIAAKIQHRNSGDLLAVASGGIFDVEAGGLFKIGGVTVTPSAAQLNESFLHLDIADGSAESTYYIVTPHAGTITKIYTAIDGVVSTADITITAKLGSTGITTGVVTIATAASAAGDMDSASPTALNVVAAGDVINFVVTGGGAGGSPRIHLVVVVTR